MKKPDQTEWIAQFQAKIAPHHNHEKAQVATAEQCEDAAWAILGAPAGKLHSLVQVRVSTTVSTKPGFAMFDLSALDMYKDLTVLVVRADKVPPEKKQIPPPFLLGIFHTARVLQKVQEFAKPKKCWLSAKHAQTKWMAEPTVRLRRRLFWARTTSDLKRSLRFVSPMALAHMTVAQLERLWSRSDRLRTPLGLHGFVRRRTRLLVADPKEWGGPRPGASTVLLRENKKQFCAMRVLLGPGLSTVADAETVSHVAMAWAKAEVELYTARVMALGNCREAWWELLPHATRAKCKWKPQPKQRSALMLQTEHSPKTQARRVFAKQWGTGLLIPFEELWRYGTPTGMQRSDVLLSKGKALVPEYMVPVVARHLATHVLAGNLRREPLGPNESHVLHAVCKWAARHVSKSLLPPPRAAQDGGVDALQVLDAHTGRPRRASLFPPCVLSVLNGDRVQYPSRMLLGSVLGQMAAPKELVARVATAALGGDAGRARHLASSTALTRINCKSAHAWKLCPYTSPWPGERASACAKRLGLGADPPAPIRRPLDYIRLALENKK